MRYAAALALSIALAGCAVPADPATAPVPVVTRSTYARTAAAQDMLAYMGRLAALREPALAAEATRQREQVQRDGSDLARVKAAIALMLSGGEESEIVTLVEPVARAAGGDGDVRSMASFLQVVAAERRRAKESAAAAAVRLRDERRASETQKQRADALQERAAQLQQKLEALTEIEKSLSDRQGTPR